MWLNMQTLQPAATREQVTTHLMGSTRMPSSRGLALRLELVGLLLVAVQMSTRTKEITAHIKGEAQMCYLCLA